MIEQRVITVFHADRATLFRTAVKQFLKKSGIIAVGGANNSREMMQGLSQLTPDLLLTSHKLEDSEADVFLPIVKTKFPSLPILMLTMAYDKYHILKYRNSLDGMMAKWDEVAELICAIFTIVIEGKSYYSFDIYIDGQRLMGWKKLARIRKDFFDSLNYQSEA